MIEAIIRFAVRQKLLVGLVVAGIAGWGVYSLTRLPIDAVPDITNNQVQIVSTSASLAPQEVEQFITYPVEVAMANLPHVVEIRSISRFGLSVVTVVFEDHVPVLEARQYVKEQIAVAEQEIPAGLASPELMPITTGLGEIYQYVLRPLPGYEHRYGPMELRTLQDWIVKRQMAGIPGVIEVSSFGGYLKQYEVALDPSRLRSAGVSLTEVFDALAANNQNTGGSYIEKSSYAYYIRTEGLVQDFEDIGNIVVRQRQAAPVLIRDLGEVRFGSPKRYGAMTMDGKGETVGGITLMLKGANSSEAIRNVHRRVEKVRQSLPEGVVLEPYLDRSDLVGRTIATVRNNLLEGGLIVVLVLILFLGNWRAGLIVASIIPLAFLFALILMDRFGLSANLMSLGAIDFGIVVDGAVIVVEGVLYALLAGYAGKKLTQSQLDEVVVQSTTRLFQSAFFGVLIILVVFLPIITLTGIEGKMFRPMALTFSFVILGALLLSLTYIPMMSALVLPRHIQPKTSLSDRMMNALRSAYAPILRNALRRPYLVLALAGSLLAGSVVVFNRLGAEFLPTLEEGDLAMQMTISPGSALEESVAMTTRAERLLLDSFPEVEHVVSKIGTAEVPTDPMAIEDADIMIILKPKSEWVSAKTREGLVEKMKGTLQVIVGAQFEFTQPIQLRFNELLSGSKSDVAVKVFGEDPEELRRLGEEAAALIRGIEGAADVRPEQTDGRQEMRVRYHRERIARYGLNIKKMNTIIRAAYAGEVCGSVFESERRFDLVVRLAEPWRQRMDLSGLYVQNAAGAQVPLSELAEVKLTEGPIQVSREGARRRITVGVNVRGRDLESVVEEIQGVLSSELALPPGYSLSYGGDFENLQAARQRLSVAVPVALLLIFMLLFFAFGKLSYALLILSAVPMAAVGGVAALWIRGMPFSISAGVGFIALFGVAVLNGIVLISYFNELREKGEIADLSDLIVQGSMVRLRPVLTTAIVAALGFLPMATSVSSGAEVQRPLATVVIGGLITATLLTLLVLPALYYLLWRGRWSKKGAFSATAGLLLFALPGLGQERLPLDQEALIRQGLERNFEIRKNRLDVDIARAEQRVARFVPPTIFGSELGNVNELQFDYRFTVLQPLSPFSRNRERRRLGELQEGRAGAQLTRSRAELEYRLRTAWQEWIYRQAILQIADQRLEGFNRLNELSADRLASGAIDRLEYGLTQVEFGRLNRARTRALIELENAREALLTMAGLPLDTPLASDTLAILPFPGLTDTASLLLEPARRDLLMAAQQIELTRAEFRPSLSVGYFIMSLRPAWALQGGLLELQVPLFRTSANARIEQARLERLKAEEELAGRRRELAQARSAALRAALRWQEQLNELEETFQQVISLQQLAAQQLEEGAIDFFSYYQALKESLAAEVQFLEIVNLYNQAVLRMEWLNR